MSAGRAMLLEVLQRTRAKYVAARCRVSPAAVSKWSSGRSVPSSAKKRALAVNYGIPTDSWVSP